MTDLISRQAAIDAKTIMNKLEKVKVAIRYCMDDDRVSCNECPYCKEISYGLLKNDCTQMIQDTLDLLDLLQEKEKEEQDV